MVLLFEDGVLCFYDFSKGKPEGSLSGHSEKIKQIVWDDDAEQYMVTSSNDGTLRVWTSLGDRWNSYAIDPPQAFEYTKLNEKARKMGTKTKRGDLSFRSRRECEYKVSAVQVLWDRNEIFAGDNRGFICLYELQNGTLKQEIPVADYKIKSISFDAKGEFMGIILSSGRCLLTERQNNFRMFITLEEESVEVGNGPFFRAIKLLESESGNYLDFAKNTSKFIKQNSLNFQSQSMYYAELESARKQDYGSNLSDLSKKSTTNELRVLTTYSPNTLRLHQITRNLNGLNSLVAVNYTIDGVIKDFDIHVSKEYLLVLSSLGYVNIFNIASGELKAVLAVNINCSKMKIDPSGLYVAIASDYLHSDEVNDMKQRSSSKTDSTYSFAKQRPNSLSDRKNLSDQSVITFYEIWTGEFVGATRKISKITSLEFSAKGNYLAAGSYEGLMTVLALEKSLQANVREALEGVQSNPDFWSNFPLFAQDDNDSLNQREDRIFTDRSFTYRDSSVPQGLKKLSPYDQEDNPPTIKRILETFQGDTLSHQPVKHPSKDTIQTPSQRGIYTPNRLSAIPTQESKKIDSNNQFGKNLEIAISNSSMQKSPFGSHPNSQVETPAKSVRFNDAIKNITDYGYYYTHQQSHPPQEPLRIGDRRNQHQPSPSKVYYNQGTQMSPMLVTPKVIEYHDIAQQTTDHDKSMRSAMSRRSEGSHLQKSINQMIQKFPPPHHQVTQSRVTEPDPADIDDDDQVRRPNMLTRKIQPDPCDVDDDVSSREYGITPAFTGGNQSLQQSQRNYLEPPIIDTRFVRKDDSFMNRLDESQQDVSEMYNDLSSFEHKFMRETTTRNYMS